MSAFREWLDHPETREYRRSLERKMNEIALEPTFCWENADYTQASTGVKEGKIGLLLTIIEELTPDDN